MDGSFSQCRDTLVRPDTRLGYRILPILSPSALVLSVKARDRDTVRTLLERHSNRFLRQSPQSIVITSVSPTPLLPRSVRIKRHRCRRLHISIITTPI